MSSRDLPVATLPLEGLKECGASLPPQLMLSTRALVRKAGPQTCTAGTWPAEPSPHPVVALTHQSGTIHLVKSTGHKQIRNETPEEGCGPISRTSITYTSIHAHFSQGWFRAEGPGVRTGMFPLRRIFQRARSLTAGQRPPKSHLESYSTSPGQQATLRPSPKVSQYAEKEWGDIGTSPFSVSPLSDHHQPFSVTNTCCCFCHSSALTLQNPHVSFRNRKEHLLARFPSLTSSTLYQLKGGHRNGRGFLYLNIFLCETVTP